MPTSARPGGVGDGIVPKATMPPSEGEAQGDAEGDGSSSGTRNDGDTGRKMRCGGGASCNMSDGLVRGTVRRVSMAAQMGIDFRGAAASRLHDAFTTPDVPRRTTDSAARAGGGVETGPPFPSPMQAGSHDASVRDKLHACDEMQKNLDTLIDTFVKHKFRSGGKEGHPSLSFATLHHCFYRGFQLQCGVTWAKIVRAGLERLLLLCGTKQGAVREEYSWIVSRIQDVCMMFDRTWAVVNQAPNVAAMSNGVCQFWLREKPRRAKLLWAPVRRALLIGRVFVSFAHLLLELHEEVRLRPWHSGAKGLHSHFLACAKMQTHKRRRVAGRVDRTDGSAPFCDFEPAGRGREKRL